MTGRTISHYRVLEKVGEGGMGAVYKAEDLTLHRLVALKFLPNDGDRARFLTEARAAAALNHPNICTVYEVDEAQSFLAMEFVDGPTLKDRLGGRPLAAADSVEIALQITEGLTEAHQRGVVHHDIKPGNILIGSNHRVKIADFGLARFVDRSRLTVEGRIAGTPAYMAPEQMRGEAVDRRADIWAFGAVLHEMLTGRTPAAGAIDPMPPGLDRIVRKCLAAEPADRYQHSEDLLVDLRSQRVSAARPRRWWIPAAALGIAGAAAGLWFWNRAVFEEPVPRFSFTQLTDQPGFETSPSLAPDGKSFVYVSARSGNRDIYLQRVGGSNPQNLTQDSSVADDSPAFSPDGERIAFRSVREGGGIFIMGATGEAVRRLTDFGFNPAWSPDGRQIAFALDYVTSAPEIRITVSKIWIVDVASRAKRVLVESDSVQPNWSPHDKRVAYWGRPGRRDQADIFTVALAPGSKPVAVTQDAALDWNPVWSPDGKYLYYLSDRDGTRNLWRVRIDGDSGQVLSPPRSITLPSARTTAFSISKSGREMVFVQSNVTSNLQKIGFDPVRETVTGVPVAITQGAKQYRSPSASPDGGWLTFTSRGKQEDIYTVRTDGSQLRQLTSDPEPDRWPIWSPDGKRIGFESIRNGRQQLWTVNADGTGLQQITFESEGEPWLPVWSPDGKKTAYFDRGKLASFILENGIPWDRQRPAPLEAAAMVPRFMVRAWSPDGNLLAGHNFGGNEDAKITLYIYDLRKHEFRAIKAGTEGTNPAWLADSRRFLYTANGKIHLLDTVTGRTREIASAASYQVDRGISVAPGGGTIYFTATVGESDIWLMRQQ